MTWKPGYIGVESSGLLVPVQDIVTSGCCPEHCYLQTLDMPFGGSHDQDYNMQEYIGGSQLGKSFCFPKGRVQFVLFWIQGGSPGYV